MATALETNNEWTVRRVLDWTTDHLQKHGSETPRLDTEILLAHARGCQRIDLYTRYDEILTENERRLMRNLSSAGQRPSRSPIWSVIASSSVSKCV